MISTFFAPIRRASRPMRFAALGLGLFLAACAVVPSFSNLGIDILEKTTQFATARLDRTWAVPSKRMIVVQREEGPLAEQKIGLTNETALPGDNFLWLRARVPVGYMPDNFRLQDLMGRLGEVPTPFTEVSDNDLRTAQDAFGTYFYLVHRTGGETNCVLAFRRVHHESRLLPAGMSVLEIILRNCVRGSVEEALLPITDREIGYAAVGNLNLGSGGGRTISPLAAPPLE